MARIAGLAVSVAVAVASSASCSGGGRPAAATGAGGGGGDPSALPRIDGGLAPADGGPAAGTTPGNPPPDAGAPPGGGTGAPPSQPGSALWAVSRDFSQHGIAPDGAGGAFLANVRLPIHAPPAPPGSFVVGSDLARVDSDGHVRWSRTVGPVPGCGVFIGSDLAPLPGGHLAVPFSEENCSVPVPELGGQTLESTPLLELDGDGSFVRRLADIAPAHLRASSDGGLVGTVGVPGATQLVKLSGGAELWRVPAATLAGSFVADVAADREGGAVIVVVDEDQAGTPVLTHLRRFGRSGVLLWNRDLPPRVLALEVAVLADGTAVAPATTFSDLAWGRGRVQVPAGQVRDVLLSVGPDGTPRDVVEGDGPELTALGDGSFLAYGNGCRVARYTAQLEPIWSRFIASLPGAPTELCRAIIAHKGAVGASGSLVIVAGQEDAASDFGGGLVTQGEGFVVGLAP